MAEVTGMASPHFTLRELTITAQRGYDGALVPNVPGPYETHDLLRLANIVLEPIRLLLGCPIVINSAYRCEEVERLVQHRPAPLALRPSQHLLGQAADIEPVCDLDIRECFDRIVRSDIPYDQIILEGRGLGRWIHVSVARAQTDPRREALVSEDCTLYVRYTPALHGATDKESPHDLERS